MDMDPLVTLTLFTLAAFLGVELITKVPPTLHTPLMSGSNAISGITLIGAITAAGSEHRTLAALLGFTAVTLAMVNVVGGFLVTHRMLHMFSPRRRRRQRRRRHSRERSPTAASAAAAPDDPLPSG